MNKSRFGKNIFFEVEGESHAKEIEFVLKGVPKGFEIDLDELREFMQRRAPGNDIFSTARKESDEIVFDNGVEDGVVTGDFISGKIANEDVRPADYGEERTIPRPGHADFAQWITLGRIPTGGGANSGRMTAAYCAAGGICKQYLEQEFGVIIRARVETIHGKTFALDDEILKAKTMGDSVGGTIVCTIENLASGIGGPMFAGLESKLSPALFAIPGVKGVEFGDAFEGTRQYGSEYNDQFDVDSEGIVFTKSHRQGGLFGGMSIGTPISFRLAVRPTPTIFKEQDSVDLKTMKPAKLSMKGRHDPCIVRRAVPVVEAVTALALLDVFLEMPEYPPIYLTLTGKTLEEDIEQARSQKYFASCYELRADLLNPEERKRIPEFCQKFAPSSMILTCRRKKDGGAFEGTEEERVDFFRYALANANPPFAFVDFEQDFNIDALKTLANKRDTTIIRSRHDFKPTAKSVSTRIRELSVGHENEVLKLAFTLPDKPHALRSLMEESINWRDKPVVLVAMGEKGLLTRIEPGLFNSMWTYASVGGLENLGHVTPQEIRRRRSLGMDSWINTL